MGLQQSLCHEQSNRRRVLARPDTTPPFDLEISIVPILFFLLTVAVKAFCLPELKQVILERALGEIDDEGNMCCFVDYHVPRPTVVEDDIALVDLVRCIDGLLYDTCNLVLATTGNILAPYFAEVSAEATVVKLEDGGRWTLGCGEVDVHHGRHGLGDEACDLGCDGVLGESGDVTLGDVEFEFETGAI
ncbi:hypothetical protein HG530_014548 [Fusarium avenaceum]|nr:hypothetical protein HG530_014548 [Fusarium avenaceum]